MPAAQIGDHTHAPLAHDSAWKAVRTAAYGLVATRWAQGHRSQGPPPSDMLLKRIGELSIGTQARAYVLAWIEDAGEDIGRFLYAPELATDNVGEVFTRLDEIFDTVNLARLEVEDHFRRTAHLRIRPSPALEACDPDLSVALLTGVLRGALSDALNTRATVLPQADEAFEVRLGPGRDVNEEVSERGN